MYISLKQNKYCDHPITYVYMIHWHKLQCFELIIMLVEYLTITISVNILFIKRELAVGIHIEQTVLRPFLSPSDNT